MLIEIYDTLNKLQLYTADITFGLDILIVNKSNDIKPDILHNFLMDRTTLPISLETDIKILKKLNLIKRKNEFGRMNEACVLYALLNNFSKDTDNLKLYPLKDEIISMINYDYRYSNIYLLKKRDNINDI